MKYDLSVIDEDGHYSQLDISKIFDLDLNVVRMAIHGPTDRAPEFTQTFGGDHVLGRELKAWLERLGGKEREGAEVDPAPRPAAPPARSNRAALDHAQAVHEKAADELDKVFEALKRHETEHAALLAELNAAQAAEAESRANAILDGRAPSDKGAAAITKLRQRIEDSQSVHMVLQRRYSATVNAERGAWMELSNSRVNEARVEAQTIDATIADLERRLEEARGRKEVMGRQITQNQKEAELLAIDLAEPIGHLCGDPDAIEQAAADRLCTINQAELRNLLAGWRVGFDARRELDGHAMHVFPVDAMVLFEKSSGKILATEIFKTRLAGGGGFTAGTGTTRKVFGFDLARRKAELAEMQRLKAAG